MLRKLYAFVHQNGCKPDDPDSPMMQEILLPGHLYLGVLSERIQTLLVSMKTITLSMDSRNPFPKGHTSKFTHFQIESYNIFFNIDCFSIKKKLI